MVDKRQLKSAIRMFQFNNNIIDWKGGLRNRATMKTVLIRRNTMFKLLTMGLIVRHPEKLNYSVTAAGRDFLLPVVAQKRNKEDKKQYHKTRADKMKAAGYVARSLWVHSDDLVAFEAFKNSIR